MKTLILSKFYIFILIINTSPASALTEFELTTEFPNYFVTEKGLTSSSESDSHVCRDHLGKLIPGHEGKNTVLHRAITQQDLERTVFSILNRIEIPYSEKTLLIPLHSEGMGESESDSKDSKTIDSTSSHSSKDVKKGPLLKFLATKFKKEVPEGACICSRRSGKKYLGLHL